MRERRNVNTLRFARAGHGRIGTRAIAAYQGLFEQVELTIRGSRQRHLHSCIVTLGSCVVKGTTRTARASRTVPGCTRHSEVISRRSRPIHTSFQLLRIHRPRGGVRWDQRLGNRAIARPARWPLTVTLIVWCDQVRGHAHPVQLEIGLTHPIDLTLRGDGAGRAGTPSATPEMPPRMSRKTGTRLAPANRFKTKSVNAIAKTPMKW